MQACELSGNTLSLSEEHLSLSEEQLALSEDQQPEHALSGHKPSDPMLADGWMMIFPGQGTPQIGMGSDVCDISPATTHVWDCASDISGVDVRKLCQKGPMTRLTKTIYQQLAVTTVNTAMLTILRERFSLQEAGYAGHSAGEYTALYAAGVMSLDTLFQAISQRAAIMQTLAEQRKGAMCVVNPCSHSSLRALIDEMELSQLINIACDNGHQQQVIGGDINAVKTLSNHLMRSGVNVVKLAVNGAWHTPLMTDGVEPMRQMLTKLNFSSPKHPIIMNLSGKAECDVTQIKENLALHLTQTVRWRESMDLWAHMGYRQYLEIGGKKILSHLLQDHFVEKRENTIQHYYQLIKTSNQRMA